LSNNQYSSLTKEIGVWLCIDFWFRLTKTGLPILTQSMMLVATVRNELSRLPYWLSCYRDLGIGQFFFVDDHSTDGTTDYLLAQPDSHVFQPRNSYSESTCGTAWQNELLDLYGEGRWTVVADADELLAYPDCENLKLPEFCWPDPQKLDMT
jgi:Glycosyl transferase family 2